MTRTGLLLALIGASFVTAEIVRPTHIVPKRLSTDLVLRSQAGIGEGVGDTLDSALLDDLPRIHPDAVGMIRVREQSDGTLTLLGSIAQARGGPGAAVFVESDAERLGSAPTRYGEPARPTAFSIELRPATLGPGFHCLRVGLVSADRRGFFLLPQPTVVRVGYSSQAKLPLCGR